VLAAGQFESAVGGGRGRGPRRIGARRGPCRYAAAKCASMCAEGTPPCPSAASRVVWIAGGARVAPDSSPVAGNSGDDDGSA